MTCPAKPFRRGSPCFIKRAKNPSHHALPEDTKEKVFHTIVPREGEGEGEGNGETYCAKITTESDKN